MRVLVLWMFAACATAFALLDERQQKGGAKDKESAPRTRAAMLDDVRDAKPATRRKAVRELAHEGSREAWLAVIAALDDPESEVGDAAQIALGALGDEKLWRELCGRLGLESKNDRTRVRVAEALGRARIELDGEMLARQLSTGGGEAARMLVWSIERLAAAGRLGGERARVTTALATLEATRKDRELSCAALVALAELDAPNLRAQILGALNDSAPERRIAGLVAAQRAELTERLDWARKATADENAGVRTQAIECLVELRTKAGAQALVALLERETRLRLRWRIVDELQRVSGLKNRLDARPWKLWADQLPSGTIGLAARAASHDDQGATATGLAGLSLISDRVCFLFDFSGSMWTPIEDGRLPKDLVAVKLREALGTLDEGTSFNLMPFTYDPLPWQPRLQPAKRATVAKALEFFETCTARGRGNYYDAALLALADPEVDTIVALTDGVPTGGFHSDMDLIVPLLLERTRYRKVAFDSILVDARLGTARRWNELSVRTGGRCVEVELGKD